MASTQTGARTGGEPRTQYNKASRRKGPPKKGSDEWFASQKKLGLAQAGVAKRGDSTAILRAGLKKAPYAGWKKRDDGIRNWRLAVKKRLDWERRAQWNERGCPRNEVHPSVAYDALAEKFKIPATSIRETCDKAQARNKYAQYIVDKDVPAAVAQPKPNPRNPDGTKYDWSDTELYATRGAGAEFVVPPTIDKAIAEAYSFSCQQQVLEPEDIQRGNTWLVGMLEWNEVVLPEGCDWIDMGGAPQSWWNRFLKRHPHLSKGKGQSVEEARVSAHCVLCRVCGGFGL